MSTASDPGKGIWGDVPPGDLGYIDTVLRDLRERLARLEVIVAQLQDKQT